MQASSTPAHPHPHHRAGTLTVDLLLNIDQQDRDRERQASEELARKAESAEARLRHEANQLQDALRQYRERQGGTQRARRGQRGG